MSEYDRHSGADMPRPKHKIQMPEEQKALARRPAHQPPPQRRPAPRPPARPVQQRPPVRRPVPTPAYDDAEETRILPALHSDGVQTAPMRAVRPQQHAPQQRQRPVQPGAPRGGRPAPRGGAYPPPANRHAQPRDPYPDYDSAYEDDPYDAPTERPAPRRNPPPRPRQGAPAPRKAPKRKRRIGCLGRAICGVLVLAIVLFAVYSFTALHFIDKINLVESEPRMTPTASLLSESYVQNILLLGTDSRDSSRGRSDSMILLSINKKTKKIVMSSLMRDMYVNIPGKGWNKLNAAYSFGGPAMLMNTIEENLHIKIDDYMQVDFSAFAGVVDAVGGVKITVSPEEAQAINNILRDEVNGLMGDPVDADYLEGGGTFVLNGKQALSYARIRYVGNADFERTERQRKVLTQMIGQLKESGVSGMKKAMGAAMPNLSSNMERGALYKLSLRLPQLIGYDIVQQQIPAKDTWSGETKDCGSVLVVDFDRNIELFQTQVFNKS